MRALFRLDGTEYRNAEVTAWLESRGGELTITATRWFEAIRNAGPDVVDRMHDGQATACVADAAFAYVGVYSAHVNVGFFQGAELQDPGRLLLGAGKHMRHVKLKFGESLDEAALSQLIHAAYADVQQRLAENG